MLRDLAFTTLLTVARAQSLFPSNLSVSTGDGDAKRPASIIATVERSFVPAPSAQDADNDDIYYTPNTTKKMCPVVSMGLEPDASPMKIKPSYRTFVPEDPLHIEVYSDKGVTFAEFFIQAKDPATNATVGHWRIDDVQQEAYKCSSEGSQALLDTVHWQSNGLSQQRKVVLDWVPSFNRDKTPDSVHFIGTFKTLTGIYEHTLSQSVLLRKDLSITGCCEQEVTAECLPMCKSTNLVDSLTMSTESCKHQMHKLQRCYLTGKDVDVLNLEEAGVAEQTNFLRVDCCSKESLDAECNTLCEDGGVNAWSVLMGTCQHALRQVTACWTSTSCVNRCDSTWRGDYSCQCDSDCTRRGDCCPDRDMSCRASLPVKLEYWSGQKGDCGKVPDFDAFADLPGEKKTSQMRFDTKDAEEGNLFGIQTAKSFAARLTSYFFVREKGTYKVFMLLGQRDTARLTIDGVEIMTSGCSWGDLHDKTVRLAGGGHQITVEFTDSGYSDQLRLAYSGPDTLRKPTMFPFQTRDQILYMGQPPVVATERLTTTKATTVTTTAPPAPTLSTREIIHERVDVRLRDETKMTERLEELVFEQKRLHEEMLARQRAEFHKDNAKLLNQLRAESEAKPASGSSASHTNLYVAVALLGGSLVGVLIAVAACYCCRRNEHDTATKDRHSNSSGNALHMTL